MLEKRVSKEHLLSKLPAEWHEDLLPDIQSRVIASRRKVVVLDDDPTGTQTVHGVPVLTEWPVEALVKEFDNDLSAFYLLTNSRSLPLEEAGALNLEIGSRLVQAARESRRELVVISRSDSTLRGHFPGEVEALSEALGIPFDGWLLIPFFLEGGRYTIQDTHYVAEDQWLIPAGETAYASDAVFGYKASNLQRWVEEKTNGRIPYQTVSSISIDDIRMGGPARVTERLKGLSSNRICVVNAASMRDLEVFTDGLLKAESSGKNFLYRTAASFVRIRAGLSPKPLLTPTDLGIKKTGGGLIIVGSYVPKTTQQLRSLMERSNIKSIEVDVRRLLPESSRAKEIERTAQQANQALHNGSDAVIYTSRELLTTKLVKGETELAIGKHISQALVEILLGITEEPRYVIAKGGITASDVATGGLKVKRAIVLGQILPGVPVWKLDAESRFPGIPYIVFPGNVGVASSLWEVADKLRVERT